MNENLDNKNLPTEENNVEKNEITDSQSLNETSAEEISIKQEVEPVADKSEEVETNEKNTVTEEKEAVPKSTSSESSTEEQETVEEKAEEEHQEIDYDLDLKSDEMDNTEDSEDSEDDDDDVDENSVPDIGGSLLTIEEIIQKLRDLLASEDPQRKDVDEYKVQFYYALRKETEEEKAAFLADGGEEIDFIASESSIFTEGKELLQQLKEKRAKIFAEKEAQKEANVIKKLAIIERIKELTESSGQEDFNKVYQEFRSLQQQWSEIKLVPQSRVNELWRSYQHYVEIFYDLVRINNEFREYDFKKNLEMKTELCEIAERLDNEPDVISAFHQLQNLHQEWREIGPVSKKERENIWNRFKTASTVINKKYQGYYEQLRARENENLALKTALCEKLEAINFDELKTMRDWNAKFKEVLDLQTQWRKIGYAPRKHNTKIYKRYRAACDLFFKHKNEFYKSKRSELEENLKKKIALCERAEAMKDSKDWNKTTRDFIELQKEWKTIGTVPRKYTNSVWERFITACDYFFDQKKQQTSSRYQEEVKNLESKNAVVEKIKAIDKSLSPDEALPILRELMEEWSKIGFVPFKMKDKAFKDFHDAVDAQYERMNIDKAERKLEHFKMNLSDISKSDNAKNQILREREKLMRQYERMKNELQTYENNIGFLSISSKKGNRLLDDMNQKMEKIKSELDLLVKKIEAIDKEL